MSLAAPSAHGRSRSKSPSGRSRDKSPSGHRRDKSPSGLRREKSPSGRGRDRSPSRKERDKSPIRSRSPNPQVEYASSTAIVPAPEAPQPTAMPQPQYAYAQTANTQFAPRQPSPPHGMHPSYAAPQQYQHAQVQAGYADPAQYGYRPAERRTSSASHYSRPPDQASLPPQEHPHYASPAQYQYAQAPERRQDSRHVSLSTSGNVNMDMGHGHGHGYAQPSSQAQVPGYPAPLSPQYAQGPSYPYAQSPPRHASSHYEQPHRHGSHQSPPAREYAKPLPYEYARPDERINYNYKPHKPSVQYVHQEPENANVIEVHPGGGALHAPPSPGLGSRMHRLSVSGGGHGSTALTLAGGAPPSPLLEAYQGTYQSISPMPSPIMRPYGDDDLSDIAPLSPHSSSDEAGGRRKHQKKRVKFYDPEDDAKDLATALKSSRVDAEPLIDILPGLTHDQMLQLRNEYKKHARVQGKGINIAKHIKMKLGTTAFGKACYTTALGKWESEAYWANFWYQSNTSRRELLIESLMGRTNADIRAIKDAFMDKRYDDSLERCMKAELKADKFRTAVLLVLEEKRQEEGSYVYPEAVRDDARRLHDALTAREGGETAMIHVIVLRSDAHLREVLKVYERSYGKNFAKEMLRKSTNLVGETLAHILNGLINRPVRDALLLHQALNETSKERNELLISRLVRFHWDRQHLERIKAEYRNRYHKELATDVADSTSGSFGEFCTELCIKR